MAIGLLLFVVPGVLMFVWGVVSGPVIVAEGCSPIRAPWRSRELVRGSFRTVLLVAFLGFVLTEAIAGAVAAALDVLPHDWALITGEYFVHVVTTPVLGMGTAVLYYALLDRERGAGRVTSPPKRARRDPGGAGSGLADLLGHGDADRSQDEDDEQLLHGTSPSGGPVVRRRRRTAAS